MAQHRSFSATIWLTAFAIPALSFTQISVPQKTTDGSFLQVYKKSCSTYDMGRSRSMSLCSSRKTQESSYNAEDEGLFQNYAATAGGIKQEEPTPEEAKEGDYIRIKAPTRRVWDSGVKFATSNDDVRDLPEEEQDRIWAERIQRSREIDAMKIASGEADEEFVYVDDPARYDPHYGKPFLLKYILEVENFQVAPVNTLISQTISVFLGTVFFILFLNFSEVSSRWIGINVFRKYEPTPEIEAYMRGQDSRYPNIYDRMFGKVGQNKPASSSTQEGDEAATDAATTSTSTGATTTSSSSSSSTGGTMEIKVGPSTPAPAGPQQQPFTGAPSSSVLEDLD